ncbi:hypothetical protein MTR_1g082540 [Medicago truncatula]|uniref:Uncharacterized protein n=1 Tax=Medicago truncatula TaxID=3880 RepID=G7I802_MEDTR|nr:hypothetical protein MTR_1g082540 [Medicago truncatula]
MAVLEGEAVVLLNVIHFADVNKWDRVVFESDSITLVQLSLHSNFEVKFVTRQANMHTLARAACSWASHRIFNSYPSCIEYWLINDNS